MIFNPAIPVRRSTSGCSSSHTSTSGSGTLTANSFLPSTSNFFVDFLLPVWYLSAIAALLSKKSSHPGLYPSPGREPLLSLFRFQLKAGRFPVAVPVQDFQSVPAPRAKHEQMPAQRILPNHRLHPLRQPVKPAAHVRRFHRQPDARGLRPIERPQTRQPHHAASTTPTSTRTCSASQPRPTTRLRPFRNRISTRASSDPCGSGARSTTSDPFAASPPWRASCTSTNLPAPPRFAASPPLRVLAGQASARSRFFHQLKCGTHNRRSRQNAATLCALRPCSETSLRHFARALLLRSRCVTVPPSPPSRTVLHSTSPKQDALHLSLTIQSITDNVDGTRSTTFTYDAWSRMKTASNSQWSITETYDRYGNRNAQSAPVAFSQAASATTNRLPSPYAYDASGNMTYDGYNTLVYDAENRVVSATNGGNSGSYTYDGNGLRVEKVSGSTATVYIFSGGKVIAEYDNGAAPSSPSREYIYSGSQLLATISGGTTTYHHPDQLSVRVSTDANGNVTRTFGHFPFGEVWYETGTASKWKFSTYERDTESGNDYAMARFYGSSNARFASPDPIPGSASDPHSLNRYSYAVSDPIDFVDFSGLTCQAVWFGGGVQVMCDPLNGGASADGGGSPHYAPLLDAPDSGGGNTSGGFFSGFLNRTKTVNRCAGQISQAGSVSNLSGGRVHEVLGSNFFGDVASLATGSGGLDQGAGVAADLTAHAAPAIASQVAVGTMTSIGTAISRTAGVYNPVTVGTTTITAGMTTAGRFLIGAAEGVLTGKVLLDAGVYVGALVVCSQ